MKYVISSCALIGILGLSACGASSTSEEAATASRFGTVSTSGNITDNIDTNRLRLSRSAPSVGRVVYSTGFDRDINDWVAVAGVGPGANTGNAVTSGRASYSTSYGAQVIDGVSTSGGFTRATRVAESGTMTMTADFGAGTLTGDDGTLDVDGTISGRTVGGRATLDYSGSGVSGTISGPIQGEIGSTGVIGAMHGSDNNTVMSGGFVGTRNP